MELCEVEELNSRDITEEELKEFIKTEPFQLRNVTKSELAGKHIVPKMRKSYSAGTRKDECDQLITKFIDGEIDIPDIYAKLVSDDDEDELEPLITNTKGHLIEKKQNDSNVRKRLLDCNYEDEDEEMEEVCDTKESSDHLSVPGTSQAYYMKEGNIDNLNIRPRKRRCRGTTKKPLDCTMQGLMGQANLMFVRGNYEMAEKLCMEIIRQNPQVADPFFTLAEMYEAHDPEKSLKFLTLAIHLDPSDCEQWKRIAEIHVQRGDLRKARVLYSRSIRIHPRDYELRRRKADILKAMGERNLAMTTWLKMLPLLPPDKGDLCLQTLHTVVRYFNYIGKYNLTMEAWESAYSSCGHHFQIEDFHEMIKLLVKMERFTDVLQYLLNQKLILLKIRGEKIDVANIFYYDMPNNTTAQLRTCAFITLIGLKNHSLIGRIVRDMHNFIEFTKDHFEYFQNIAEMLLKQNFHECVIMLLKPIIQHHFVESPTTLLLQYAQALLKLERVGETIDMFTKIVEIAPLCYDARFTLAALLKQHGREVEATKVLKPPEDIRRPVHTRLLYERSFMLLDINEVSEALEIGCTLLGRYSIKLRNRQEMLAAANGGSAYNAEGLKVILEMRNIIGVEADEVLNPKKNSKLDDNLCVEDEYKLFLALYSAASKYKKYSVLERLCFAMVTTKRFSIYSRELEHIMVLSSFFNNDYSICFNYLRELIHKDIGHMGLWNILSLLVQKGHDLRYHRYIVRLVARRQVDPKIKILMAHYHLHSNSFKYALNIYAPLLKEQQLPVAALCIAVVFNQIALQKKILRKCAAISQSLAFIQKYSMLRAGCDINKDEFFNCSAAAQEINYNIGRIYHQVGIIHLAVFYYEKALNCQHPLINEHVQLLGLTQEIAFNLHLVYKASGNITKARQYLYEYCVV